MKAKALLDVGKKADHGDGLDAGESAADANLSIENVGIVLEEKSRSSGGEAGVTVGRPGPK